MEMIWLIRLVRLRLTWPGFLFHHGPMVDPVFTVIHATEPIAKFSCWSNSLMKKLLNEDFYRAKNTCSPPPTGPQKIGRITRPANDSIWGTDPRVVPRGLCSSAWLGGACLEGHGFERWCTTYILRVRKGLQRDGFEKCTADLVCLGKKWIYYIATSWS